MAGAVGLGSVEGVGTKGINVGEGVIVDKGIGVGEGVITDISPVVGEGVAGAVVGGGSESESQNRKIGACKAVQQTCHRSDQREGDRAYFYTELRLYLVA